MEVSTIRSPKPYRSISRLSGHLEHSRNVNRQHLTFLTFLKGFLELFSLEWIRRLHSSLPLLSKHNWQYYYLYFYIPPAYCCPSPLYTSQLPGLYDPTGADSGFRVSMAASPKHSSGHRDWIMVANWASHIQL